MMITEKGNTENQMTNRFIKDLSRSKVSDLLNYVFSECGQCMVTEADYERSEFKVHFFITDEAVTYTLDPFEGVINKSFLSGRFVRSVHSCMEGGQLLRFQTWMYHNFKDCYLKELARFMKDKYDNAKTRSGRTTQF